MLISRSARSVSNAIAPRAELSGSFVGAGVGTGAMPGHQGWDTRVGDTRARGDDRVNNVSEVDSDVHIS